MFIISFRIEPRLSSWVKKPKLNIAGMVLIPKINITTPPQIGLPVLAAVTAKK